MPINQSPVVRKPLILLISEIAPVLLEYLNILKRYVLCKSCHCHCHGAMAERIVRVDLAAAGGTARNSYCFSSSISNRLVTRRGQLRNCNESKYPRFNVQLLRKPELLVL